MRTLLSLVVCAAALSACNQDSAASTPERDTHMGSVRQVEPPPAPAAPSGTSTASAPATGSTTR